MSVTTLLLLATVSATPRVEISTLSGDEYAGKLKSISGDQWTIEADGKDVQVSSNRILTSRFFSAGKTAEEPESIEIRLTDGSSLRVAKAQADSRNVKTSSATTADAELPKNFVRSIRFAKPSAKLEESWKELSNRTPDKDMIVVQKKDVLDFVEGVVGEITETHVNVLLDGENIPVKRERVFGIVYYQREPGKSGNAARVELVNGDRFLARRLTAESDSSLTVVLAAGPEVTLAAELIKSVDFSAGRLAWIDEMKPRDLKHEYQIINIQPELKVNRSLYGEPLKIGSRSFDRGICVRSKTNVRYRLNGDFNRFQTWIGIQDTYKGDVVVTISCDGTELFSGEVAPEDDPKRLDLDVSGKYSLEILVDYGKLDLDIGDLFVLGDARLLK